MLFKMASTPTVGWWSNTSTRFYPPSAISAHQSPCLFRNTRRKWRVGTRSCCRLTRTPTSSSRCTVWLPRNQRPLRCPSAISNDKTMPLAEQCSASTWSDASGGFGTRGLVPVSALSARITLTKRTLVVLHRNDADTPKAGRRSRVGQHCCWLGFKVEPKRRSSSYCRSSQVSSRRQPLKMLFTIIVNPLTRGCMHVAPSR
jgi:hypothetical protein